MPRSADYEWPRVTVVHPEHGSYQFDVHCLRNPSGTMALVAFQGMPSHERVLNVRDIAAEIGDEIESLTEADLSTQLSELIAAHFHADRGVSAVVVPVKRR